jgi:LysM repeat protein
LKKAGYATNPRYADLLIRSIEANSLYVFDRGAPAVPASKPNTTATVADSMYGTTEPATKLAVAGSRYAPDVAGRVKMTNRVEYIILTDTDTYESLRQNFDLLPRELDKYNEQLSVAGLESGQKLYLQPKRNKAEPGVRYHTVKEGETMYFISQQYAVKLERLYEMNFMDIGSEPETGRRLNLR